MKTKILIIAHIPPPVHGSSVVGGFIKGSKLINESFNCRYINLGTSVTVDEIGNGWLKKISRFLSIICQVKEQLISFRPHLCYIAIMSKKIGFYKDAVAIAPLWLFGKKRVYHLHSKGVSTRHDHFFDDILYRFVFRNSDIILLSKKLYPDIQKYFPEERVHYCPNGIPEGVRLQSSGDRRLSGSAWLMAQGSLKQAHGTDKDCQILFLSNLIESKGIFILLEACRILRNKKLHFHCSFAGGNGDITEQQFNRRINEYDLHSCVSYTGKKHGEEKEKVFASADVFVLPTFYHNECMPLVLLEAMQHSLPVISTNEGAIPDIIEDGLTGFIVPQKDPGSLADKLEILIKNPALRISLGQAGREKYEREFTLERFENRMVEILEEVGSRG